MAQARTAPVKVDHGNHLAECDALEGGLIRMRDGNGNELLHREVVVPMTCEHGVSVFAAHGCVECSRIELEQAETLPENFLQAQHEMTEFI